MSVSRTVITALAITAATASFGMAQSSSVNAGIKDEKVNAESVAAPDGGSVPSKAPNARTETLKPTIEQEIEALRNRINELENEVRQAHAERPTDGGGDAAALRTATKRLLAGTGAGAENTVPGPSAGEPASTSGPKGQKEMAPAAAPAPPEISAQRTTKGEPFPGDWTWLNSNGHASDSPMATKYFTPEFRADAHYMLDYNHPKDDTMGGATESFRSDEWQLEQISIGGDIHIDNVRGRILTMNGLFATTTPRNDATPTRGQWDLSNAYKYVSEAWGASPAWADRFCGAPSPTWILCGTTTVWERM